MRNIHLCGVMAGLMRVVMWVVVIGLSSKDRLSVKET